MSKLPADHPFRRHSKNLAVVKKGLVQIERVHRAEIRRNNLPAVDTVSRLHALVIGMMAEAKLRAITWDPDGFNERERNTLLVRSQLERWKSAVEAAFRRHFDLSFHRDLDQFTVGAEPAGQFTKLVGLLDHQLEPIISDRNKTAHAQWAWHLNSKETGFVGPAAATPNYSALKARSDLINAIGDIVHVLVVSQSTFARDFKAAVARIDAAVPLLDGIEYEAYVTELRRTSRP